MAPITPLDVRWGGDGDVFRLRSDTDAPDAELFVELWSDGTETWLPCPSEPVWRVMLMPTASDALLGKVGLSLAEAMLP